MDTARLRRGFGTAAGRATQAAAYMKECRAAADEIDRLEKALAGRYNGIEILIGEHPAGYVGNGKNIFGWAKVGGSWVALYAAGMQPCAAHEHLKSEHRKTDCPGCGLCS